MTRWQRFAALVRSWWAWFLSDADVDDWEAGNPYHWRG